MHLNTDRIFGTQSIFPVGLSGSFIAEKLILGGVRILSFSI